ncbi:MAG: RNA polymerase sigma factor [Bacteroidia bacterium]|nr:RNA polymerase sigma factor [Bacteroidia bacterium]
MQSKSKASTYPIREEERILLEACLRGDAIAQKQLYDRYKDAMFTLAYRICNDFEVAQDALQEGFVGVFRGMKNFRKESTLGAWIKTIIIRTAYKKLKKETLMQPLNPEIEDSVIDWGGQKLDVEYLEKAIQALPSGYRSVFVLIEVEGYAHKEVANILGISVGTSKSQLFYAKRQLRKQLNAMGIWR